jgi:hypothetical protein
MSLTHHITPAGSDQTVRFCWLRESQPSSLEYDLGVRIAKSDLLLALLGLHQKQQHLTPAQSPVNTDQVGAVLSGAARLASLPDWARRRLTVLFGPLAAEEYRTAALENWEVLTRVASRVAEAAGDHPDLEVHLPLIERRDWPSRFEILDAARFVIDSGRLMPENLASSEERLADYNVRLLALAATQPSAGIDLLATRQQTSLGGLARIFLPVQSDTALPDGFQDVELTLRLKASGCAAWRQAPNEDSHAYFPVHAQVSVGIQSALRRWLAFRWFSSLERFQHPYSAYPLLAYFVSSPFPGRRRVDFAYDTLGSEWIFSALRCARRPLRRVLVAVRRLLVAAGQDDLAGRYIQADAKRVLDKARRERRTLHSLITADGVIVNHVLKFGIELREAPDARTATLVAKASLEGLVTKLRHCYREPNPHALATAILFEATHHLSMALGGGASLTATVTTRAAADPPQPSLQPSRREQQPLPRAS